MCKNQWVMLILPSSSGRSVMVWTRVAAKGNGSLVFNVTVVKSRSVYEDIISDQTQQKQDVGRSPRASPRKQPSIQ